MVIHSCHFLVYASAYQTSKNVIFLVHTNGHPVLEATREMGDDGMVPASEELTAG